MKKLIEKPHLEDPAQQHMDIHRHFYRYSRGDFLGPALKIRATSAKITLKGTHEYEDLILESVVNSIEDANSNFEIKGNLITGSDISKDLSKLGLEWKLKKSTGKTKNYKSVILDNVTKEQLLAGLEFFRSNSYVLLSFIINPSCKITTKKNIPQPSKKTPEDDDLNKRIQFCTGILKNTKKNMDFILDSTLSDFKSELPKTWKSISILNNYKITEIETPKDLKDSRLLRIFAIRKGKMIRSIDVDDEVFEKQYDIVV
ncbi:MAG: hypothetical protein KGD73_00185 [Candidatus Lokiarchaeota archaeon]|nr:hypothetical protein [Candidatus Lokiarchaeota archaeon]